MSDYHHDPHFDPLPEKVIRKKIYFKLQKNFFISIAPINFISTRRIFDLSRNYPFKCVVGFPYSKKGLYAFKSKHVTPVLKLINI